MGWQGWLAIIGGIVAVVGNFWGGVAPTQYYLPTIGGVLAVIAGIGLMMK